MKLASLKSQKSLDGELVVVAKDLKTFARAGSVAPSLREVVENWSELQAKLSEISDLLNAGKYLQAEKVSDEKIFHSALPRTWLFADGSAFIHHIKLVRQARKAALPETLLTVPLMYQAESGKFLAPTDDIPQRDFAHGTDFEAVTNGFVDGNDGWITDVNVTRHESTVRSSSLSCSSAATNSARASAATALPSGDGAASPEGSSCAARRARPSRLPSARRRLRASFATIASSHGRNGAPRRKRGSARQAFVSPIWAASSSN